jgi:hypothetical protein
LDGELLFNRFYVEMGPAGSMAKLAEWCKGQGFINPKTGKAPTAMGVYLSMWRWAVHNPKAARVMFEKYFMALGEHLTDEMWNETLDKRAKAHLTTKAYERLKGKK